MGNWGKLAGQRILVTGARGFLGSHLYRALLAEGAEVHAVSRTEQPQSPDGPTWWTADVADTDGIQQLVESVRPHIVYQLTSYAWGSPGLDLVIPTFRDDLLATVNVLTAAAKCGVQRLIMTGSMQEPDADSPNMTPCSPYAAAKWAGGAYARMFSLLYNLPIVVVRPFMVYGPGQAAGKLIPYVIRSLAEGTAPQIGAGDHSIDFVFVDDVVEGMVLAATAPEAPGQSLDLGSGQPVAIREIAAMLVELMDSNLEPKFGAAAARPFETLRVANTAQTEALLGWRAKTSLSEGLSRTVKYYIQHLQTA